MITWIRHNGIPNIFILSAQQAIHTYVHSMSVSERIELWLLQIANCILGRLTVIEVKWEIAATSYKKIFY